MVSHDKNPYKINSQSLLQSMSRLLNYFEIIIGIQVVQSDSACISDVVEEFLKLGEYFTEDGSNFKKLQNAIDATEMQKAKQIYINRSADRCVSMYHYVANYLDPRYRGARFQNDHARTMNVLKALESYAQKVGVAVTLEDKQRLGTQLTSFRMGLGLFSTSMLHHPVPMQYWRNYLQFPDTNILAQVGCRLLSIPASSAGVERSFSMQGYIHNKSRNRLGEVKMDKLMRIKWSLTNQAKSSKHNENAATKKIDKHFESLPEESDDVDIDELVDLGEAYEENDLFDVAANSS